MPKTNSPQLTATTLVPKHVRDRVSSCIAYIDFKVPREQMREFAKLLKYGRQNVDASLGVTPRGDEEIAFTVHRLSSQGTAFHVIVEFRRGRRSPFPRVDPRKLAKAIAFIDRIAKGKRLESWSESAHFKRANFDAVAPQLAALMDRPATVLERGATITGLHISVPSPLEGRPPVKIGLNWNQVDVTVTITLRGESLTTFADAFEMGHRTAVAIAPRNELPAGNTEGDNGRTS